MKKSAAWRLIIGTLFLVCVTCGCGGAGANPDAAEGKLDLSAWDFEKDGIAYLDGGWEFYWGRLLTPRDFSAGELQAARTGFFNIPGYWNGRRVDGRPLKGDGHATFRLVVRLAPGEKDLALRIEDQATAYRLWVNGSPVLENGVVADRREAMQPYRKIGLAVLPAGARSLDLVLQVSNYHLFNGGPYRRIALGTSDAIARRQNALLAVDLLLCGILGFIGVYHLVFHLLRKKDPSLLYFSFFCLSWSIGIPFGAVGGRFITLIWPEMPWYWIARMELLTWFPIVPLFLMFFASLFPSEFSVKVTRCTQVAAAVFFTFVVCAPSRVVGWTEIPYQIFSIAVIAYICLGLYRALRRRRSEAGLMLAGFLLLVATVINDILYMNLVIHSVYLVSVGIAVLIFFQAFALARRLARSFAAVETLTEELEQKNIALSSLDKLKDEFLANTSHELRTPLNGIVGIAESLIQGVTGMLSEKTRRNLALIVASGRRLSVLINDILDLSRLRNRDIRLRCRPVDLRTVADTVLRVMFPLAETKPLALHNEIPGDLPPVLADEERLQQILYNLVGNAIKYTDQGMVRLSAGQVDSRIEVAVADTGVGIPEEKQEMIFQSFEQADASDARAYGGAGLGLSITRQLVELHGGAIGVNSAPGRGAVFRFTLPAAPACQDLAGPRALEEAPSPVPPAGLIPADEPAAGLPGFEGGVTILAVDDDPINLQVIANYLAYRNVTVLTAAGARQAIAQLETGPLPDLVLLDIMMPHLNGYEMCRWLRQRYTSSELPVIFLTAKNAPGDLAQGFAEGASDYLAKPFARDELIARVVSQLKLKHAYVTLRENLSLRRELEERKASERELRVVQRRLGSMLDSIEDALLAVNESGEVTFCNRICEKLLGCKAETLLGRPLGEVLGQQSSGEWQPAGGCDPIRRCFDGGTDQELGMVSLARGDGTRCPVHIFLSRLDVEEEPVCLLVIRKAEDRRTAQSAPECLAVVETLNRNRARLQAIETSLNGLLPLIDRHQPEFMGELKAIDEALEHAGRTLLRGESHESRRHLAAEVMTCALDYWIQCTGLSKKDLAHQSRLWKTYTNQDGWERTQTLDRYLDIETFPLRPAWSKVLKTAEFVLANGKVESVLRSRLEVLLTRLRVRK